VTTGKDIVSTTGDVVKAKEALSRIEKKLVLSPQYIF
jgi:hypothetical protein